MALYEILQAIFLFGVREREKKKRFSYKLQVPCDSLSVLSTTFVYICAAIVKFFSFCLIVGVEVLFSVDAVAAAASIFRSCLSMIQFNWNVNVLLSERQKMKKNSVDQTKNFFF